MIKTLPPTQMGRGGKNRAATKKGYRHPHSGNGMKPFPQPKPATVFAMTLEHTLEEELQFLGALAQLKDQHPTLKVEYATCREGVYRLLENAWFLHGRHVLHTLSEAMKQVAGVSGRPELGSLGGPEETIERLGAVVVPVALERSRYLELEERAAKERYDRIERLYHFQESIRAKMEVKEPRPEGTRPFPAFNFAPRWNRGTGYLLWLTETLGLKITAPAEALKPWGELSKRRLRLLQQDLDRYGMLPAGKFAVVDFTLETEEDAAVLAEILRQVYGFRIVDVRDVLNRIMARQADGLADLLVGLLAHPDCMFVAGPAGLLTHAAAAAGVEDVLLLYTGDDYAWDAPTARRVHALQRDAELYSEDPACFRAHFGQQAVEMSRFIDRS